MRSATRGWKAPRGTAARRRMREKHGCVCFLDAKNLKYPICNSRGNIDCRGLAAAKARAAQQGRRGLVAKADKIARSISCRWAKSSSKARAKRKK